MQSIIVVLVKLHRHFLFCLFVYLFTLLFSEQAEGPKPSWRRAWAHEVGVGHGQWEQPMDRGRQRTCDSLGEEDTCLKSTWLGSSGPPRTLAIQLQAGGVEGCCPDCTTSQPCPGSLTAVPDEKGFGPISCSAATSCSQRLRVHSSPTPLLPGKAPLAAHEAPRPWKFNGWQLSRRVTCLRPGERRWVEQPPQQARAHAAALPGVCQGAPGVTAGRPAPHGISPGPRGPKFPDFGSVSWNPSAASTLLPCVSQGSRPTASDSK